MILTESRTRTRQYLDDEDATNARWSDTELDDKLKAAQNIAWRLVADRCNLWTSETTVNTTSAGVADLSTIKPIRIVSVGISYAGISRWRVPPARVVDGLTNVPVVQTLRIAYVPRPLFPTAPGNAFVWGAGAGAAFDTDLLDAHICQLAASMLKVKDGEVNQGLEAAKQETRQHILDIASIPRFTAMPLDAATRRRLAPYYWILTAPDTLQLVA